MAVVPICIVGDPVLHTPTEPVPVGPDGSLPADLPELIQNMFDTMDAANGVGLAANQIGVALRAFSYNVDGEVGYVINPELVEVSGEPDFVEEGCLSVPGFYFPRNRFPFARVRGVDLDGNPVELSGEGLMAQALQHEVDHLDGHLYIEGLAPETKKEAMRLIRMAPWY